ncbi:MAG: hypothetical protein OEW18_07875, partial [Candidatus Aminicenantes bacterium]|nr:hypothetical protein [Candidatus Aminicenantes bacterium]
VKSGEIGQERIDQSVHKLLYWKARLNLHQNRFVDEERVNALVGTPEHLAVVQKVADESLTLLKNDGVLPVKPGKFAKMVNISIQKADGDPSTPVLAAKLAAAIPGIQSFSLRPDMDASYYEKVWPAVEGADLIIISLFVPRNRLGDAAPLRDPDIAFIYRVIAAKPKDVVAMSYGNPHLIRKIDNVPAFLVGYGERGWFGNQAVYFDSFVKVLKGEIKAKGKLPVLVSGKYPIGCGLSY